MLLGISFLILANLLSTSPMKQIIIVTLTTPFINTFCTPSGPNDDSIYIDYFTLCMVFYAVRYFHALHSQTITKYPKMISCHVITRMYNYISIHVKTLIFV